MEKREKEIKDLEKERVRDWRIGDQGLENE